MCATAWSETGAKPENDVLQMDQGSSVRQGVRHPSLALPELLSSSHPSQTSRAGRNREKTREQDKSSDGRVSMLARSRQGHARGEASTGSLAPELPATPPCEPALVHLPSHDAKGPLLHPTLPPETLCPVEARYRTHSKLFQRCWQVRAACGGRRCRVRRWRARRCLLLVTCHVSLVASQASHACPFTAPLALPGSPRRRCAWLASICERCMV